MWIYLVLVYGLLKGLREVCKKKALQDCTPIEILLIYTLISFILITPDIPNAFGMEPKFYIFIFIKSFVIFVSWILSFYTIKKIPLSLYGVLDLSRVLFTTLLGITILGECLNTTQIIGLFLVCFGLLCLKFPGSKSNNETQILYVILGLISCLLNAISALLDKLLMKDLKSSQLQVWFLFFLLILYFLFALVSRQKIDFIKSIKNKWIWLISVMFVIGDRALFIANSMQESQITIMTLIKQSACIVTIVAGKVIFKEKNITHKIICASIVIAGIVLGTLKI